MKVTSFAIILYLVFLLTQPCQDVFARPADLASDGIAMLSETQETEEAADECSPFCICSCCSISVAYQTFVTPNTVHHLSRIARTEPVEYSGVSGRSFSGSIWQPPKA